MISSKSKQAFTLIELLIVVAIIAILAAIAVPNFLEAQVRSKVSRARADMRSIMTGIESYRVDYNKLPPYLVSGVAAWWGYTPPLLTTPVAYLSGLPRHPFLDKTLNMTNGLGNQLYTYLPDIRLMVDHVTVYPSAPASVPRNLRAADQQDIFQSVRRSSYLLDCCGPDGIEGTPYGAEMTYDPTNGTTSYGDIYTFGTGTLSETQR
jgi:prepilin-type N-terminal cleavage/methylation domain-containing protein